MDWIKLLSLRKQGDKQGRLRKEQDETRIGFEVDYDRIAFSDYFRSLQDKTQVIPLSKTDFVHTRLTHSLEVSVVARSLGRRVGKEILRKHQNLVEAGYTFQDFGAIVASSALAHDIGNPPFGHSGERAISDFFRNKKELANKLSELQYADLSNFEGNANGFRILTESRKGIPGGLRLSYATLGTFTKYPKESLPIKPTSNIADKKYGFFQSEKLFFEEVAEELGMISTSEDNFTRYSRHPLAFLVEAADDICYTIIDFEDGVNLGLISEEKAFELLQSIVEKNINRENYQKLSTKQDRIAYLRALAIGVLIQDACEVFIQNEKDILEGNFHQSLLDKGRFKPQMKAIIALSVRCIYQSNGVVEKEIAGYAILQDLLEIYYNVVVHLEKGEDKSYDHLVLQTIPEKYIDKEKSFYQNLLGITCYIASLTDGKAVELHSKFKGLL
ncbi:MAG: dNTP triphosphohydrolase [Flavobacteriaceae bacterium]|nr:dNTP triphosphohydrolase [Flavobacteriaceae bacterium]